MVSEEERLKKELEEARQALEYQRHPQQHFNEFFELEAKIQINSNSWLLNLDRDELETRVERLEQDLQDLERGEFQKHE